MRLGLRRVVDTRHRSQHGGTALHHCAQYNAKLAAQLLCDTPISIGAKNKVHPRP